MLNTDEAQVEAPPHAPEVEAITPDAPLEQPQVGVAKDDVKVVTTKERKKAKAPAHPPYFQMIKEAITALNEKSGSSPYAIAKYMEENHKNVLPTNFRKILGLQLKNSVSRGKLIKIKASFKLSEVAKKEDKSLVTTRTTKTRAARANAAIKTKDGTKKKKKKRKKVKSREISKIEDHLSPPPSLPTVGYSTRGRRSKRSAPSGKWRQLKPIRSPVGKKAKKSAT